MHTIFAGSLIALFLSPVVPASPVGHRAQAGAEIKQSFVQQNLIGEISSIDAAGSRIIIQTDTKTSVTVAFNEKTIFRRVAPGETSLASAETIKVADLKIGDRLLVPGWSAGGEQTPVKQIVVMARASIEQSRNAEAEKRRARTVGGRITAVNPASREITVQTRGRGGAETLVVTASANAKLLRYAPDSLKLSDAVAASFADLRIGDQIRVVGDRSADGAKVVAEEIVSGSVSRFVGIVSEVNAARGELIVKNDQTGQTTTVAIGKNTTLRRITPEVAAVLKERFERRAARRRERSSNNSDQPTQSDQTRRRDGRRNQNSDQPRNTSNRRQLFEDLPAITVADLKKGDAVLMTGTTAGDAAAMTAVSIIAADGDLQQILLRWQGVGVGASNMSPGLPGNVSGGSAGSDDDEPR